jgi:hypothetical protein
MAESVSTTAEDLQVGVVSSVAELYGSLSYCAPPTSNTPTVARALTSSIVSITVSMVREGWVGREGESRGRRGREEGESGGRRGRVEGGGGERENEGGGGIEVEGEWKRGHPHTSL